jgi:hypothetical protein
MATIICPKCGTENSDSEMNCTQCRINLKFALENLITRKPEMMAERDKQISEVVGSNTEGMEFLRKSVAMIRARPYVWYLALLAVLGDLWAVSTYDPHSIQISIGIFGFALIALVAEAGLIHSFIQYVQGKPGSFVDSLMTAITFPLQILGTKAILLIVPAIYFVVLMLTSIVVLQSIVMVLIAVILALLILLFVQVWTVFTFCGVFSQGFSIGGAVVHGWRILWEHKWRVTWYIVLFVVVDLVLTALLVGVGAVTFESAFIYTVTPEMAEIDPITGARIVKPGDHLVLNRPIYGYLAAIFRGRGVDLLSVPLYFSKNMVAGLVVVVLGIPLLLLRIAVLTLVYFDLAEPTLELSTERKELIKEWLSVAGRKRGKLE